MLTNRTRLSRRGLLLAGLCITVAFGACNLSFAKGHGAKPNSKRGHGSLVIKTDKGKVKGIKNDTMREFLGIPYAAPPVGNLRWAPPQPAKAWHGVRKADTFASNCPQSPSPFGNPSTTENCLYLNVFVLDHHGKHHHGKHWPKKQWKDHIKDPVMVWIHGGAFVFGESSDYNPEPLVKKDVVVVTINYRLGMLGFLADPALSAASGDHSSGDYGLLDQQAALEWVQHNIANFGGNPHNVTIFGVSAGGLSVLSQMASPKAEGLFQKAIIESGSYSAALPHLQPTLSQAEARGTAFAQKAGCANQRVACLRNLTVNTILANQQDGPLSVVPNTGTPVLPQSISSALMSGNFNQVPVMEGTNKTEWRLFAALAYDLTPKGPITPSGYLSAIEDSFFLPPPVAQVVAGQYPLDNYPNPDLALSAAGTAAGFACPARRELGLLSQHVPTYAYQFSDPNAPEIFVPPVSSFDYGPTHTSEIQYFLDFTQSANLVKQTSFTPDQTKLSNDMIDYWTQFAHTGDPNPSSGVPPFWPEYNNGKSYLSLIPPDPKTLSDSDLAQEHNCGFWDNLVSSLSAPTS